MNLVHLLAGLSQGFITNDQIEKLINHAADGYFATTLAISDDAVTWFEAQGFECYRHDDGDWTVSWD